MVLSFFIVMFVLIMNFMWKYIDELVGKGLDLSVILELMMYASITAIPMGLPLATLFGAIMTMGNLGENYELLAMKSSGMSLMRILKPLLILMFFVSIGSFFVANNLVPYSYRKMQALRDDISKQKQEIEFKDGLFFNGVPDISIRIDKQNPETKLLTGVLIYDTRNPEKMTTTVADSGYITIADDRKSLLVTLYQGELFEENRGFRWYNESTLTRNYFHEQNSVFPLTGFDFSRSDGSDRAGDIGAQNIAQLEVTIDSIGGVVDVYTRDSYEPFVEALFVNDKTFQSDSLFRAAQLNDSIVKKDYVFYDSLETLTLKEKARVWSGAVSLATNSKYMFSYDEDMSKRALNDLYKAKNEWHKKISLPVSVMIFFIIGAALGAIIRKGGLGMPVVVSVLFFVVYYVINMTGEKMAKEGTWSSFAGMWLSTFVLTPIAAFLVYKATNDSNLFNSDWYVAKLKQFVALFKKKPAEETETK